MIARALEKHVFKFEHKGCEISANLEMGIGYVKSIDGNCVSISIRSDNKWRPLLISEKKYIPFDLDDWNKIGKVLNQEKQNAISDVRRKKKTKKNDRPKASN